MGAHRELAIAFMKKMNLRPDFMSEAKIPMPEPIVPGAMPAMAREMVKADELKRPLDAVLVFGIGDYPEKFECSAYYDPSSPWYNVFYGAYGFRSYKRDGSAWGYKADGTPDFDEFLDLAEVDYNHLTGARLGCPPELMSFQVLHVVEGSKNQWNSADVVATVPSGLHEAPRTLGDPSSYVLYGVPDQSFLANGRQSYEPVRMRGLVYMRRLEQSVIPQPLTLAWGAMCPDTDPGHALLNTIITTLGDQYFPIGQAP